MRRIFLCSVIMTFCLATPAFSQFVVSFQTDGEKWNRLQEIYREVGSLETAIEQYKQLKHKDYETDFSM